MEAEIGGPAGRVAHEIGEVLLRSSSMGSKLTPGAKHAVCYNVGKTIINHPSVITIFIDAIKKHPKEVVYGIVLHLPSGKLT